MTPIYVYFRQSKFLTQPMVPNDQGFEGKRNCLYLWTRWSDRNNFNIKSLHISNANIFLGCCSALLSLLSFGVLSGFCPMKRKQSKWGQIFLSYFVHLSMIQHSKLKKRHFFTYTNAKMEGMSNSRDLFKNVNKREIFKKLFSS